MRDFRMFQADAFADRLFAGNPAAVMVLDDALPEALMQQIAAENNLSETAFVVTGADDMAIRWFTPTHEAAFCGHATLAAAHILMTEYGHAGPVELTTRKVGTLRVERRGAAYELDLPRHDATPLAVVPDALGALFPAGYRAVLKNFENYFVVLNDAAAVRDHAPDTAAMKRLDGSGIAITAVGGNDHDGRPVDFTSRYFAPAHGIDEDPVTGSAHATLAPYWAGVLGRADLIAYQASSRGGRIGCRVTEDRVYLTGQAITYLKGTISLPV
jgi:PhzF family phenazine biosynthesis protein